MYNFDPYNVFLAIATNIHQRLNTDFVLQGVNIIKTDELVPIKIIVLFTTCKRSFIV